MFIDTHVHLDMPDYQNEVTAVLMRAKTKGVEKLINIGVNLESSRKSWELARRHPEIYAAVGLHPDSANDLNIETQSDLLHLTRQDKVVAIGEVGLDYYYLQRSSQYSNCPSKKEQIFCFEQMLDMVLETQLPVIVHTREAEEDTLAVLKGYTGVKGVIHCFSGDLKLAESFLDLGFSLSFTGNITFKNNKDAEEVIKNIPLGSIMIETDCPFLAPEPYRGKKNEPVYVAEVARKIAEIKGISLAEVESETTKKAKKLFGI